MGDGAPVRVECDFFFCFLGFWGVVDDFWVFFGRDLGFFCADRPPTSATTPRYHETSAESGHGVNEVFESLLRAITRSSGGKLL
jgi:hypothetical protein